MENNNTFDYMGLELLNGNLHNQSVKYAHIICYHINSTGKFPFIQFLLCNNYNPFFNLTNTFNFPLLDLDVENQDIETTVKQKIEYYLNSINCKVNDINDIIVNGIYNNKDNNYLFVDVSKIDINGLFLNKNSKVWFVLTNEIINNINVCNIPIDKSVYLLFLNEYKLFSLINPLTKQLYSNPDVAYSGSFYKQTEFQSIFGVNKTHKGYGEQYYFLLSFNDAFKYGGWTENEKPLYKFDKLITDNEYGRYIVGGINRVAILTEHNNFIHHCDENLKEINNETIDFETSDSSSVIIDKISYIIVKDYEQQISLSFHKIDKSTLGKQWENNNCYSIE